MEGYILGIIVLLDEKPIRVWYMYKLQKSRLRRQLWTSSTNLEIHQKQKTEEK